MTLPVHKPALLWALLLALAPSVCAGQEVLMGESAVAALGEPDVVCVDPGCDLVDPVTYMSQASDCWQWHVLPKGTIYHTYWASLVEPRLAYHIVNEEHLGAMTQSSLGGRMNLLRFGPKDRAEGFQLDMLAAAKLRQDADNQLSVDATDYRADILLTYGDGPDRYKFGYYHVSSHLGDDYLAANPGVVSPNFVRDALVFGYSYYWTPKLRLYGEVGYGFNTDISEPWELQFGIDWGPDGPTGMRGEPFFAINGHLREEQNFGGHFAVQTGWAWRGEGDGAGTVRFGLSYFNGKSRQFSFYDDFEQQIGAALWYDF